MEVYPEMKILWFPYNMYSIGDSRQLGIIALLMDQHEKYLNTRIFWERYK